MASVTKNLKKILGVVALVVVVALVAIAAVTTVINRRKNKPTFFFGYAMLWVETGSMEPTIDARSYIWVKQSDGQALTENTVITFVCQDQTSAAYGYLITHRITEVTAEGYKTQGDASAPDPWTVSAQDVVAVYVDNLPFMTVCGRIFASPVGLILIFAIFLASCVFLYLPDFIKAFQNETEGEKTDAKEQEIARRVAEEVEKLRRQNGLPSAPVQQTEGENATESTSDSTAPTTTETTEAATIAESPQTHTTEKENKEEQP